MSEGNVEIVRRGFELYAEHGLEGFLEFAREHAAAEVELLQDPRFPEARPSRGMAGIESYAREFLDMFASHSYELEELVEAGDTVFAIVHERARGKGSGVDVEQRLAFEFTFRDKMVARIQVRLDWSAAD